MHLIIWVMFIIKKWIMRDPRTISKEVLNKIIIVVWHFIILLIRKDLWVCIKKQLFFTKCARN